ncbi:beta-1,3-glucan-binding protein 1-like [Lycorma delicatula]|uniref:beta-1,3-glucan-binding protein 1-like n=1 Tax=Lycorma delicatula TaxID=130591 RepID=UPI003F518097
MLLSLGLFFQILLLLSNVNSQDNCLKSPTQVNEREVCSNKIIFEENFDSLDTSKWRNTIKISSAEEEEFVVYDNDPKNIYIQNGKLIIQPTVMSDAIVINGTLNLKRCTGRYGTTDCYMKATSFNILPPIKTAQISSKFFSFKYGIVEIRAKLPSGNWLYPQLWLEPKDREYGHLFNSGRIGIACAHGNEDLKSSELDISSKMLKSGVVVGVGEKVQHKSAMFLNKNERWNKDFHNYTLVWRENSLDIIVDGRVQQIVNQSHPLLSGFAFNTEQKESTWPTSSPFAPFDKEFFLTIGVAAGGMREFPNDSTSSNSEAKPWKNKGEVKFLLKFWEAKNQWYPTWKEEESSLQVDYIKITSL